MKTISNKNFDLVSIIFFMAVGTLGLLIWAVFSNLNMSLALIIFYIVMGIFLICAILTTYDILKTKK
ncbi:TPA_asm: hypothetical protein [Altiarchaeum virus]|nr:MAG: hypothetical protein BWK75_01200 [Candidatus Altiarchaeales archaeon A3]DAZ85514.1 TPA_asm: hypothetical protein [Altiarchaeum virus]